MIGFDSMITAFHNMVASEGNLNTLILIGIICT